MDGDRALASGILHSAPQTRRGLLDMSDDASSIQASSAPNGGVVPQRDDDTIGAHVLTGALAILQEVPANDIIERMEPRWRAHLEGGVSAVERLARSEARALDDAMATFTGMGMNMPHAAPIATSICLPARSSAQSTLVNGESTPPSKPKNPLPSFGLGLKRQRSMCPPSLLTDEEEAHRVSELSRCASALGRLARCQRVRRE